MPVSSRVHNLRESKGLSLRALAEAAGVSPATLSQVESGQTSPSVATLEKLADGLGMSVAAFFLDESEEEDIEVFSLSDRPEVKLSGGSTLIPLAARHYPVGFEPILVRLEPGGEFDEDLYGISSSHAYAWVRLGSATLECNGHCFPVSETQSVYYDPRKPHNWRNSADEVCELLIVRSR
ncbi:MAG: helix-turn-helix domain-containing protein [Mariprofundaceae bacterium]